MALCYAHFELDPMRPQLAPSGPPPKSASDSMIPLVLLILLVNLSIDICTTTRMGAQLGNSLVCAPAHTTAVQTLVPKPFGMHCAPSRVFHPLHA